MKIKTVIVLLAFIFAFSYGFVLASYDGSVANSFAGGNGSENNPYHISTPSQLALLAKNVAIKRPPNFMPKSFILPRLLSSIFPVFAAIKKCLISRNVSFIELLID